MSLAERLRRHGIVAVVRRPEYGDVGPLVDALAAGGIEAIEFTFTGRDADRAIRIAKERRPDLTIGAGTVTDGEQLDRALVAGADFAVSPVLDEELLERAAGAISLVPGVLTPSELVRARRCGCEVVKVFPAARVGGPAYIRDLLSVQPGVSLLPTGGIASGEVRDYLEAGAAAVGLGGSLLGGEGATAAEIEARAREASAQLPATTDRR